MKKILLFAAICIGLPFLLLKCMGAGNSAEPITVNDAFSHPSMGMMKMGVVFMEVKNTGPADAIIGVQTSIAARAELHEHVHDNGVMKMRKVDAVELPTGQTVQFQSGGLHVMLFDLKQPLKVGDNFPLTLKLKSGAQIEVKVTVDDRD